MGADASAMPGADDMRYGPDPIYRRVFRPPQVPTKTPTPFSGLVKGFGRPKGEGGRKPLFPGKNCPQKKGEFRRSPEKPGMGQTGFPFVHGRRPLPRRGFIPLRPTPPGDPPPTGLGDGLLPLALGEGAGTASAYALRSRY